MVWWQIYSWFFLIYHIFVYSYFFFSTTYNLNSKLLFFAIIWACGYIFAWIGLFSLAYRKRVFSETFWKRFYVLWIVFFLYSATKKIVNHNFLQMFLYNVCPLFFSFFGLYLYSFKRENLLSIKQYHRMNTLLAIFISAIIAIGFLLLQGEISAVLTHRTPINP